MINISGEWKYSEEFDNGKDIGIISITQNGEELIGEMRYTEYFLDHKPLELLQTVRGRIEGNKINLKGQLISFINMEYCEYYLDEFDGVYTSEGKIVGSTMDQNNVCGVFVLERVVSNEKE